MRRALALSLACALAALVAGCGGVGGVSKVATVTVYVTAPLCAGARQELTRSDGHTGAVRVRAVCLPSVGWGEGLSLAAVGANARRATEDSTAVGYIAEPQPVAIRFSSPILESAGIASIYRRSGVVAMAHILRAVRQAGSADNLRVSVRADLRR